MKKRMTWSEMMHVCAPAQAQSGFACPSSARRTADCCAVETILLDTIFVILLAGLVLPEILAIPAELIRLAVLAILLVLVVLANRSLVPKEQPLFSF